MSQFYSRTSIPIAIACFLMAVIPSCSCGVVRWYKSYVFDVGCGGRIKRAADANTVALAVTELSAAVTYATEHGLTSGNSSIIFPCPSNDVGFWHTNLSSALAELRAVSPEATQLERTNVLMKLRETLLDTGSQGKVEVTLPSDISVFPSQVLWVFIAIVFTLWTVVLIIVGLVYWPW